MIFLSAQPDSPYFIWQLDVQLHNFSKLRIAPENIHVLISYNPAKGVNSRFSRFISLASHLATFYLYPDNRTKKNYMASIRPHIISQHFFQHPELCDENIFYHDSDIVFTDKLPDFDQLLQDDVWYFSDTRSYLDSKYIKLHGEIVFTEMCNIVGIDEKLVIQNDDHCGGAQYLLKKTDHHFWNKIERDAEDLYNHLRNNKSRYKELYLQEHAGYKSEYRPISNWCADMWALFWNAILHHTVRISPMLDFCWPHEPLKLWDEMNIFHNAGVLSTESERLFYKSFFTKREPYEEDFSYVPKDVLSSKYTQLITDLAESKKYDLMDATFTITVRIDSADRLENLSASLRFILKHFNTTIMLLEADKESKIPPGIIPPEVQYIFVKDDSEQYLRQQYNNYLLRNASTDIVIKYDVDAIVPPSQMNNAVNAVRSGNAIVSYPFDGRYINVKGVLRTSFIKTLDIRIFSKYITAHDSTYHSYGACVIVNKRIFFKMGIDNEGFKGWGFEDQEVYKRAKILGMSISRQEGTVFHLHHQRGTHSYFFNYDEVLNSYREFMKVCNMDKDQLTNYIAEW
jgi:hypothetical protein